MKKKMTKGLTVLTAAVLMFAFAGQAGAFCVHNMSDKEMHVEEASAYIRRFDKHIAPTQSECCNWANKDCNGSGGQTDPIRLDVDEVIPGWFDKTVCSAYTIPANGDLYIYKKNDGYVCGQTLPPMPVPPPPPVIK